MCTLYVQIMAVLQLRAQCTLVTLLVRIQSSAECRSYDPTCACHVLVLKMHLNTRK